MREKDSRVSSSSLEANDGSSTGRICTDNSYASGSGVYDLTGWDVKDYQAGTEGAPKWAALMREGYNRLLDQAEWWGLNRQQPD